MLPYNGDFMEFLDNIMEFLWSFLYHIVESEWSLEILIQNFDTTMWSFRAVSLPDSGVFLFNFNTIKWNSSGVLQNLEIGNQVLPSTC